MRMPLGLVATTTYAYRYIYLTKIIFSWSIVSGQKKTRVHISALIEVITSNFCPKLHQLGRNSTYILRTDLRIVNIISITAVYVMFKSDWFEIHSKALRTPIPQKFVHWRQLKNSVGPAAFVVSKSFLSFQLAYSAFQITKRRTIAHIVNS